MKIISWNINGAGTLEKKGFFDFVRRENPDIICLQETKTNANEVKKIADSLGYQAACADSVRIGNFETCGVAVLSRNKPMSVRTAFVPGQTGYEGRILICKFPKFLLFNCYFPTSTGKTPERRKFYTALKRSFYRDCYSALSAAIDAGNEIILCGDFNTAREDRDVADAEKKHRTSGFTRDDRDDIERLFSLKLEDAFRIHTRDKGKFTWWSSAEMKKAKKGWRIDYFLLTHLLATKVTTCTQMEDLVSDDHCPVILELSEH